MAAINEALQIERSSGAATCLAVSRIDSPWEVGQQRFRAMHGSYAAYHYIRMDRIDCLLKTIGLTVMQSRSRP